MECKAVTSAVYAQLSQLTHGRGSTIVSASSTPTSALALQEWQGHQKDPYRVQRVLEVSQAVLSLAGHVCIGY